MDTNTSTRTSVSAYLRGAALTEPDEVTRRLLEFASTVPKRRDMARFTPSQRDDIVADALRRCREPAKRSNRKGLDVPPTEGLQKWLDERGLTHDPLKAYFEARLREAQRYVEYRQEHELPTVSLTPELLERVEKSRARFKARTMSDGNQRGLAPIDLEVQRMLRAQGARAAVDRGVVRAPDVLKALADTAARKAADAARYAELQALLPSEADPAWGFECVSLQDLERAFADFVQGVERIGADWRKQLQSPLEWRRKRAEIALAFPILYESGNVFRPGSRLPDDRLIGPGAFAPFDEEPDFWRGLEFDEDPTLRVEVEVAAPSAVSF